MTAEAFTHGQMGGDPQPFLAIFIPGKPEPKGSLTPVVSGFRMVFDKRTKRMKKVPKVNMIPGLNRKRKDGTMSDGRERYETWARTCKAAFTAWGLTHRRRPSEEEDYYVELYFILPRPPSLPARIKRPLKKPDLDKLARCVYDSMKDGAVIFDDSRVVCHFHDKRFPQLRHGTYNATDGAIEKYEKTGVHVKIWLLD